MILHVHCNQNATPFLTLNAPVVGVKVGGKVFGTRLGADKCRVGDTEVAGAMPGAGVVER